ncbi:MAG: peptidyl-prolyl cis-trans isomerase [Pseudonocardiales bacterium]|nr:Cyclophilin [Pseudonocardia sp.]MDT7654167.1 peptidyl-prolyl cis-trans isomerase [Pseudonocardiales bacterium]
MATNQMRRDAAKRKLANQQQRRAERARRRQRIAIITSAAVVVVVVVGVVLLSTLGGRGGAPANQAAAPSAAPSAAPAALGSCTFTPTPTPASKPAPVPNVTTASTSGTVPVSLQTDRGAIPLTLNRATGPCAVESFLSLAKAGFYNNTPCHRLTTTEGLKVLQCGDPTGSGSGGPGYTINDEPPTGLAPAANGSVVYPRGTVAMAKTSAPNSGGSQFFLVYADSTLPPDYTVFGTIGAPGLATLDAVAKAGSDNSNGTGDGKPVTPVSIQSVTVG